MRAEVLRELGAARRTFRTPRAALLWYRDQLARRLRVSVNMDPQNVVTTPGRERSDMVNATFAAVAVAWHGVPDVAWLVCWYETRYGDGIWLAEKYGITRWAFMRRMRKCERLVRERLDAAGLLEEVPT